MGTVAPAVYVDPPGSEPHRFGLFSASQLETEDGVRWENGVEWEPLEGERAGLATYLCDTDGEEGWPLTSREGERLVEATPFVVLGSYSCKATSRPRSEAENRARMHLTLGEERAVELAVWSGLVGAEPSFQGADDVTPAGGPVPLRRAVGVVEQELAARSGSQGTLHLPRVFGGMLFDVAMRSGEHLETWVGSYVAAGAGYGLAEVGPDGDPVDAGTAWLVGTSRPTIRRSSVWLMPDEDARIDRGTNDLTVVAARTYMVGWSTGPVAVLVDVDGSV